MNCPSCGKPTTTNVCPYCGADAAVFIKIAKRANAHYNRGLTLARNGDLTGAAAHLSRSLVYNKRHIDARNLLGLVLCTTGRIAEGLKHWVISLSMMPNENLADSYMAWFQQNPRRLEALSNSVRIYNQALTYLRQKNEDMAVIQLKKAVEANPDFVDALNLLALSYITMRDRTHALQCLDRVLAKDSGNTTAWRYYRELNLGTNGERLPAPRRQQAPTQERPLNYPVFPGKAKSGLPISGIITFIVGAICAFAVTYVLLVPQMVSERDLEIDDLRAQITDAGAASSTALEEKDGTIADITAEKDKLAEENAALVAQLAVKEKEQAVLGAMQLYNDRQYEEALKSLQTVTFADLPENLQTIFTTVDVGSRPSVEKAHYNAGLDHYNRGRFDQAKEEFLLAEQYAAEGSRDLDDAYYFLGQIAEKGQTQEDLTAALAYYQKVIDYPATSNRAAQATRQINALTATSN